MTECAQVQQRPSEDSDMSGLLDGLYSLIDDVNQLSLQTKENLTNIIHQTSSDDDISSDDSEAEDEVTQQQETMEDLQNEMSQLEISEEASTLETLILIVEHYAKAGDTDGFQKNVRRPDLWLMTLPRPKVSDITRMADNLVGQNFPFRAALMYKCACTLYKYEYVHYPSADEVGSDTIIPNVALRGIEECMKNVLKIMLSIFEKDEYEIYFPHFVPIAYDMLTNLREIHHTDRKLKADIEMWGMLYIAVMHGKLKQVTEMHDVADTVVETILRRFKSKARRRSVYGIGLLALSTSQCLQNKRSEGSESSGEAIKSLQDAEDFPTWDDKVRIVEKAGKYFEDIEKLNA
ncbi:uncharacterized protein LOC120331451 [Styela clava]|uniref:uncharacterized protein LOC120331451 n=1 Tax=Styela clava TaxID=7725 RepID=UPI001939F59D|nr:uncharacterized protein LOC120331451 [Styela clava]